VFDNEVDVQSGDYSHHSLIFRLSFWGKLSIDDYWCLYDGHVYRFEEVYGMKVKE
jgi:hypothetical protein